jgi:hypothetical protein
MLVWSDGQNIFHSFFEDEKGGKTGYRKAIEQMEKEYNDEMKAAKKDEEANGEIGETSVEPVGSRGLIRTKSAAFSNPKYGSDELWQVIELPGGQMRGLEELPPLVERKPADFGPVIEQIMDVLFKEADIEGRQAERIEDKIKEILIAPVYPLEEEEEYDKD